MVLAYRGQDQAVETEGVVLMSVRQVNRVIEAVSEFIPLVPNVGTNVGVTLPDVVDATDIAAVPGHIHIMRGRIHAPVHGFGASENAASLLLTVGAVDADVREVAPSPPASPSSRPQATQTSNPFDSNLTTRTARHASRTVSASAARFP